MGIVNFHISFYREVFNIPDILSEPILTLGYQDICGDNLPEDFNFKDLKQLMISKGKKDITTLDFFDNRADLNYDMNFTVPIKEHNKYGLVFDIGTLEHVFDTKQCIENCLSMVKVNGYYFLHTVVNGYFGHGLHVFNPETLIGALKINNFEILYLKYSTSGGEVIDDPSKSKDSLIWIVGKKTKVIEKFNIPQQSGWFEKYSQQN